MDDCVNLVLLENLVCCGCIAEIHFYEGQLLAQDFADTLVVGFVAIAEIVGNQDIVPCLYELHGHVASDESGSSGYQNSFLHIRLIELQI